MADSELTYEGEVTLSVPLRLPNGASLNNRLAKAAMSEALGTADNRPTQGLVELYRRWAASGIGLLITGNVMVDRRALAEPGNVVVEDDRDLPILRDWARAATSQGVDIWVQLNHPGKQSPRGMNKENLAPSAVSLAKGLRPVFGTPRAATSEEIEDIIERFGRSAAIVKEAGFSGVQIHGAHGYLVSQFLSPRHNQRDDEWGGTPEKRSRFVLAIYEAIRAQVGPDFPVGIKLNSADFQRGGFTEEESLDVMKALVAAGIDLIEISGGTYEAPVMMGAAAPKRASTLEREAYFLDFAERVRDELDVPLMVTGGFATAAGMNAALASGALDLVGVARLLVIDPEAPAALLKGENSPQRVRPIKTGIPQLDRAGLMEILWYEQQLHRIAAGRDPRPNQSGLSAFGGAMLRGGWGMFRQRRG